MGGFKLSAESFKKPIEKTFWDVEQNETADEKEITRQQMDRQLGMTLEESASVDKSIANWKESPALAKNVMAVIPKRSAFLKDEIDTYRQTELERLQNKYEGAKLAKKTADLEKKVKKQKKDRAKKALKIVTKAFKQEDDLQAWNDQHLVKLAGLKGKKKTKHIAGLTTKMQQFVRDGIFLGKLDTDSSLMSAYEKMLKNEKDMRRLKIDSEFFADSIDANLKDSFANKYKVYEAVNAFLKKVVVKLSQGVKRSKDDLTDINKLLGENVLIKGTGIEKIFSNEKKETLENDLKVVDYDAEVQQARKDRVERVGLVNECQNLSAKSQEIKDKWEAQGVEEPVFDEKGKPVMTEKLNPLAVNADLGGIWNPFLDENGDPVMIQKTVAPKKEELRKKLNEHTERSRYGGYTKEELQKAIQSHSGDADTAEFDKLINIKIKGDELDKHITGYSGEAFQPVNNALRYNKYGKVKVGGGNGCWEEEVKDMVNDLKKDISHELPEEICLTRHGDLGGLACMFGLQYDSVNNVEELMEKIGQLPDNGFLIRDKAFLSTTLIKDGVAQGRFRQGQVEFRMLAPKGTKGLYIESMSLYPETEQELILDAGTIFRVTKIDATGEWTSSRATADNNKKVIVYMEAIPKVKKVANKQEGK